MLERLSLWNVGGVDRCNIDLKQGFTVITGESGAGKSSIVRALELISGKRGQSALIRAGEEEAGTEAVFEIDAPIPDLEEAFQPMEEAFFAKRILSRSGRGRTTLQGIQVPLNVYASALGRLIQIQSQFAQMELLDAQRQLRMLDSCGGDILQSLLERLRETFERARIRERELKDIADRRSEIEQRYANASDIIPLIRKVAPTEGLETFLEQEIAAFSQRLTKRTKIIQNLDRLTGGLSEHGLLDELNGITEILLESLPAEIVPECRRLLLEGIQNFRDVAERAEKQNEVSPSSLAEEIERLEQRLGALRKLKRLTGAKSEQDLLAYCRQATENLEWLQESYEHLEKTTQETRDLRREASQLALELRKLRKEAAKTLEARVNVFLSDLGMEGIGFAIRFVELPKLRRNGADSIEFTLFTDKREGRVDKIASGGELSRLLLALQLSLPDEWLPPVLVFDEVEAGLGGKAAVLSGVKLQELSRKCQVLLVTHEASIAALGNEHYVVRREGGESKVSKVEGESRIHELARMLSGNPELPEAQEHARRLLNENRP